jgi:hypothetical protein
VGRTRQACAATVLGPVTADWLRLARLARILPWLTPGWLGLQAGVAVGAAVIAGSVALLGFGLGRVIEAWVHHRHLAVSGTGWPMPPLSGMRSHSDYGPGGRLRSPRQDRRGLRSES